MLAGGRNTRSVNDVDDALLAHLAVPGDVAEHDVVADGRFLSGLDGQCLGLSGCEDLGGSLQQDQAVR